MSDKNVESVRQKLLNRSEVGLKKYGVTTERTDHGATFWLRHLQAELLDGAVYVEAHLARACTRDTALAAILELAMDAYDTDGTCAQNTALAHIMKLVEEAR